jgi:hypothetical protein
MAAFPSIIEHRRANLQNLVQKACQELDQAIQDCAGGDIDVGYDNQSHPERSWAWQQVLNKRATLERAVDNIIRVSYERPELSDVCQLEDPEFRFYFTYSMGDDLWGNSSSETKYLGTTRLNLSHVRRLAAPIPKRHLAGPRPQVKGLSSKQKTAILWIIILLIVTVIFVGLR